jgi:hypothetical protein
MAGFFRNEDTGLFAGRTNRFFPPAIILRHPPVAIPNEGCLRENALTVKYGHTVFANQ